jgi:cellobiose-specific phosphotransferase system component IIA
MTLIDFPNMAASADDRRAEPAQPQSPVPEEPAAEQFQARIEELTQERDQARRELDQARQELELAHRVQPRAVGPDHPSRCSVCLKQRNAVKAMFTSPRRHHQFSLCNECIDEMHRASNEFIAKESPSMQPSLAYQDFPPWWES